MTRDGNRPTGRRRPCIAPVKDDVGLEIDSLMIVVGIRMAIDLIDPVHAT